MQQDTVRKPIPGEQIYRVLLKRLRQQQAKQASEANPKQATKCD